MIAEKEDVRAALLENEFWKARRQAVLTVNDIKGIAAMCRQEINFCRRLLDRGPSQNNAARCKLKIKTMQGILQSLASSKPYRKEC
jgi:hypothetical protein